MLAPAFTERTGGANPFNSVIGRNPVLADVDGDGDLDAAVGGGFDQIIRYYENTGTVSAPAYVERTGAANPFTGIVERDARFALADFDGDNDLDMLVGDRNGTDFSYFENVGTATSALFLSGIFGPFVGIDVGQRSSPVFADLDGDGRPDLVVGDQQGFLHYFTNEAPATITVIVNPVNDTPTTQGTLVDTNQDTVISGALGASDVDGDVLSFSVDVAPRHGTLDLLPDGSFTYTPVSGYTGGDTFTFEATDGSGLSALGTAAISIGDSGVAKTLSGGGGNDSFVGSTAADILGGASGDDRLWGLAGGDTLSGGSGTDIFVFGASSDGIDTLTDFVSSTDEIEIAISGFGGGLATGALAASRLVNAAGHVADQAFGQFLYDTAEQALYWDDDGTSANAPVKIANLTGVSSLTTGDFLLV